MDSCLGNRCGLHMVSQCVSLMLIHCPDSNFLQKISLHCCDEIPVATPYLISSVYSMVLGSVCVMESHCGPRCCGVSPP